MGLFGGDDNSNDAMLQQLQRNRQLYSQLELPKYKEEVPNLYDNESATAKLTSDDPVAKSKQLEAIAQMQGLSNTGLSDADKAGFNAAHEMGDQMARAKTGAVMQDAQARGVAGGGMEFALRDQGNQDAAQRAQDAAMQQAAQASTNRGNYLQAYAGQLGNVRQQDYNTNAANTNTLNQFNMANTQNRNATNQANTGLQNQAFQYNEGLKDRNYGNQVDQANRMAGINTTQGQMTAAEQEANRRRGSAVGGAIGGLAGSYFGPAGAAAGSAVGSNI